MPLDTTIGPELLALRDVTLSDVARITGGRLVGEDAPIRHLRPLSADSIPDGSLAYASGHFVDELANAPFEAAIVPASGVGASRSVIVHEDPQVAFFALQRSLAESGAYPTIASHRGDRVRIADSAVVHDGTVIGDDVRIGDHVVVMPNSVLDDGVEIQAGTVVGEPGFQVAGDGTGRYLVPHAGGVHLRAGVSIGANCAVDRALFSTFTTLGADTMLDNLVHVAHDVMIGDRCTLTASVELSGSVVLEDDVWLAPRTCCNQFVRFGRGAYTGTGSVVVRDVPAFTLVAGSPARVFGRVCLCRAKLPSDDGPVECGSCGRRFLVDGDAVAEAA